MKEVQALKTTGEIELVNVLFKKHSSHKISSIWSLGLQVALRINDLLSIKYSDINNGLIVLTEKKTGKTATIKLNTKALAVIEELRQTYPNDTYLFQSNGNRAGKIIKPISASFVSRKFKEVSDTAGLHINTHSMRKTRGYFQYKSTNDIASVMKMLRHSSVTETLRYIGITQETLNDDFDNLIL